MTSLVLVICWHLTVSWPLWRNLGGTLACPAHRPEANAHDTGDAVAHCAACWWVDTGTARLAHSCTLSAVLRSLADGVRLGLSDGLVARASG
jgi:hypothetical protein